MRAYSEAYLKDVVENQGKLFDFVAQTFPDKDTEEFINAYMKSKTRESIDEAQAYVNTMDAKELWKYFLETDHYVLKQGNGLKTIISICYLNKYRLLWHMAEGIMDRGILCLLSVVL